MGCRLAALVQAESLFVRACAMVSQIFGPSEEREDATQAVEPFMLAREPVVVQWEARNFG